MQRGSAHHIVRRHRAQLNLYRCHQPYQTWKESARRCCNPSVVRHWMLMARRPDLYANESRTSLGSSPSCARPSVGSSNRKNAASTTPVHVRLKKKAAATCSAPYITDIRRRAGAPKILSRPFYETSANLLPKKQRRSTLTFPRKGIAEVFGSIVRV